MANKYTDFQNGLAMALAAGAASGGAGVTEITKAEYDALSEEEKNNGKLYLINDYAEGGIVSSDVSGMESTVLWEGAEYADGTIKEVSFEYSIDDYDMVYVLGAYINTSTKNKESHNGMIILKPDYYTKPVGTSDAVWGFCINNSTENSSRRLVFCFSSDKTIRIRSDVSSTGTVMGLTKIVGLKFKAKVYKPENEYSLEEKRIGTWIDGKPLYQKVFVGTHSHGTLELPLPNADKVIEGHVSFDNDGTSAPEGPVGTYYYASNDLLRLFYGKSSNKLLVLCGGSYPTGNYTVIAKYTKTTD